MDYFLSYILLFGISGGEILILFLLILILFGPKRIPEIARTLGKGINEIKKVQRDINAEIHKYSDEIENPAKTIKEDIEGFRKDLDSDISDTYGNAPENPAGIGEEKTGQQKSYQPAEDLPYPYNQQQDLDKQKEEPKEKQEPAEENSPDTTQSSKNDGKEDDGENIPKT